MQLRLRTTNARIPARSSLSCHCLRLRSCEPPPLAALLRSRPPL